MADFPSLPLWTDAYLADTTHLSTEEHGAYLLLLMAAWRSPECRLPDDNAKLARFVRATPRVWARLRPVLAPFFLVEDGFWLQKRLSRERKYVADVSAKRSKAAHAKHLKDKETGAAHAGANGMHPHPTEEETLSPPSQAKAHSDPSDRAAEPPPKDAKSHLWREMKAAIKGCDPSVTDPGALVGKWIVHAGGGKRGEGAVFAAHLEAMTHEPAHYLTWMHRQFNGKATKRGPPSSADLEAEALRILNESESSTDDPEPADPGGPDAAARRYEASGHLH